MKATRHLFTLASVVLVALMALAGCAQDVGDLNRVQPNYVKKSDFQGEWYIRQTVVDVPPNVAFAFVGYQLDMEKIRWEITEDYLLAYRSYELVPGANPDAQAEGIGKTKSPAQSDDGFDSVEPDAYKDAPIAAYRILSHFDIQRQYNPATGEQTNVIVENMSDRPWNEREYMRVDWGRNVITNYTGDLTGGIGYDNVEYVQEIMGGEYAFRMEDADGNPVITDPTLVKEEERQQVHYIDWGSRIRVPPPLVNYGGRAYPACYFFSGQLDCTAGEVVVRTSILRAPEKQTYEPRVYDDNDMQKFGFFRTERVSYDDRRGRTDSGEIKLANLHNIWETAYYDNGELMPVQQRQPKPVVYALSPGFPKALVPAAEEVARGWAKALTRAVAAAKGVSFDQIFKEFPYEDANGNYLNEGLFRLDYNEDGHARIGDLRYNFIAWVDQPQFSSPLGYGPSSADPETGEIISAEAFVYGAAVDTYAQYAQDIVDLLNGDLDIDEFTSGEHVKEYIANNRQKVDPRQRLAKLGRLDVLDRPLDHFVEESLGARNLAKIEAIRQFGLEEVRETRSQKLARIKGTPFEAMLMDKEIRNDLVAQGLIDPNTEDVDQSLLDLAEPLTLGLDKMLGDYQTRIEWASRNNIWLAEFSDPSILGLARQLKDSGLDREAQYQWLRSTIFRAVSEHEVGHTLGLRHNFQGSYDAINYFPEYWELRKENLVVPNSLDDTFRMAELTPNQINGQMREYQYSSIMDYGAAFNSDVHGLGRYDEAAILFGYANHVEVFTNPGRQFRERYTERYSDGSPRFENRGSPAYDSLLDNTHYSQAVYMLGDGDFDQGILALQQRTVMPWETVRTLQEQDDPNRPLEVPYMFCSDEWVGVIGSCHRWDEGADPFEQVLNVKESWYEYYWLNNFRRDRYGWTSSSVLSRSYSRYFSFLPNVYQHWLFGVIFGTLDDNIMYNYSTIATYEGLNFLMEVLAMPSYGSYKYDPDTNSYQLYTTREDPDADFYVARGDGRYHYSRYDFGRGYYYHRYPQEAGHFWDWIAALLAITDDRATVLGVETQSDFSTYIIPYFLVFDQDMTRVFNGIITEDFRAFAPRIQVMQSGEQTFAFRPGVDYLGLYDDNDPFITTAPILEPQSNFTKQFYALLYGMAFFTSNFSMDFPDQHKIFRLGSGESLTPADGFEVVEFQDTVRGHVYAALRDIDGPPSAAVQEIETCNRLRAEADDLWAQAADARSNGDNSAADQLESDARQKEAELDQKIEWLNISRGLYDIYGRNI